MHPGTTRVLTALHSFCHSIGLTNDEAEAVASTRPIPDREAWRRKIRFLESNPEKGLDRNLTSLVLRWLSLESDEAFAKRYGLAMRDTIVRDRERLGEAARVLEVSTENPIRHCVYTRMLLSEAWSERARRLHQGGPHEWGAAIAALEQALVLLPWGGPHRKRLLEELSEVCEAAGDTDGAKSARERLERIEVVERERDSGLLRAAVVLTVLWCMTHRKFLLPHERDLDPEIRSFPKEWDRVRECAMAGRVADIPIPTETIRVWGLEGMFGANGLVDCDRWTASALCAVELLWGDSRDGDVAQDAIDQVLVVAARRRETLLAEYRPPSDAVPNVWYEAHQGTQSRDAKSRVAILRRFDWMFARSLDPWTLACVALDRAAEHEAEGRYGKVRWHLEKASRLARSLDDAERREGPQVALARWLWRCGEVAKAKYLLVELSGDRARELARRIEDKTAAQEALAGAERVQRERSGVESWSALALAHLDAGHGVVAERVAGELCASHPEDALAWETRARVCHSNARYLAALDPVVKASELAGDVALVRSLLARVFARLGKSWREHAGSIAAAALEFSEGGQVLPIDEIEELAEICHRAEFFEWARRGDDLVWARRAERETSAEWIGAAVARRCHGVWADDAPEWLARLAEGGSKALARWASERVETLQHWCDLLDRQVHAPAAWLREEPRLTHAAQAILREADNQSTRLEARRAAFRGARGLGYSEEKAKDALGELLRPVDAEDEPNPDSASHWTAHLAPMEAAFGPQIVIALRASEIAQQAWAVLPDDRPTGAALLIEETFQAEKVAWIRWAGEQLSPESLSNNDAAGLTALTRDRLAIVGQLARYDDEELRRCEWATRWDELDRW